MKNHMLPFKVKSKLLRMPIIRIPSLKRASRSMTTPVIIRFTSMQCLSGHVGAEAVHTTKKTVLAIHWCRKILRDVWIFVEIPRYHGTMDAAHTCFLPSSIAATTGKCWRKHPTSARAGCAHKLCNMSAWFVYCVGKLSVACYRPPFSAFRSWGS